MKAMILAAGLGTRLRPLTIKKPKALMPVANKPVLGRNIEYLKKHGVGQIVVNAHHHQQQIVDFLNRGRPFGLEIDVRVEPEILGTGGGIRNTSDFWDREPFIVMNSDILTDIDLSGAYEQHKRSGGLATLILHEFEPFNQIQTDNKQTITEIAEKPGPGRLAFTGIHILDPGLLSHIPEGQFSNIMDCYRKQMTIGEYIRATISTGHHWQDIGTISSYIQSNKEFIGDQAFSIGKDCHIHPSVKLVEWAVVGEKNHLEPDVEIRRSILWEGVRVKKEIKIIDSIVTSFCEVDRDLIGEIY